MKENRGIKRLKRIEFKNGISTGVYIFRASPCFLPLAGVISYYVDAPRKSITVAFLGLLFWMDKFDRENRNGV